MARIRTIKPEFPQSESMGRVSRDARLCFIELWTIADDSGRTRGSSRMLASLLFPYDDDAPGLIDTWLGELATEHCITRYIVEGQSYIQINNWFEHQKIDRPSQSHIPSFANPREPSMNPRECSSEDQGPRTKEGKGKDQGRESREGSSRIEKLKKAWNESKAGPECRLLSVQFRPEDASDCLRTMSVYTDDEIVEAIGKYAELSKDPEADTPRYGSFVGFMRGGVEKFVSSANPQETFRVKQLRRGLEKPGALDDRPDATSPEEIAREREAAAEEAMSPEEFAESMRILGDPARVKQALGKG